MSSVMLVYICLEESSTSVLLSFFTLVSHANFIDI